MIQHKKWKSLGPVVLSALSFGIIFAMLEPLARLLDPSLTLFASRGAGKIVQTILAISHVLLLLSLQPLSFLRTWFKQNIRFLGSTSWLKDFFTMFIIFFTLHSALLGALWLAGYTHINPAWGSLSLGLLASMGFGFLATFMLAWTEELIFRGTVLPFLKQFLSPLESIFWSALVFMLCHDFSNPLNLLTVDYKLGLGLFLLGFMLALIFHISGKLYAGMGAHAGLVFVKVIMRRAPLLIYLPASQLPWFVNADLRQSFLVHALFVLVIISLMIAYRDRLKN
ncbi:CPBP family intramembrane metalloprotease [Candidatus Babeliales bacterium]|nr:CPBP family intramembrane metalloprotease [Candidatus Babeliales bacterium]